MSGERFRPTWAEVDTAVFSRNIDAILRRLYDELGERPAVVATGGLAHLVVPFTEEIEEIDDLLTLTGLRLLHERNA